MKYLLVLFLFTSLTGPARSEECDVKKDIGWELAEKRLVKHLKNFNPIYYERGLPFVELTMFVESATISEPYHGENNTYLYYVTLKTVGIGSKVYYKKLIGQFNVPKRCGKITDFLSDSDKTINFSKNSAQNQLLKAQKEKELKDLSY